MVVVTIANLSAIVTGAVHAAQAFAVEMLPAAVTRDAAVEATKASVVWLWCHLWAWLVATRAVAAENLPVVAATAQRAAWSALEASEPWLQMAVKLWHELYGWLVPAIAAAVEKFPDAAQNAARLALEASEPWLEMAGKLSHELYGWLVEAIPAAVEKLPDAAGLAFEDYEPWLQMAAKLLHGLYGWLVTAVAVVVERLPGVAKNAAGSMAEASEPWVAMAGKLLQVHELYGRLVAVGDKAVENLPDAAAAVAAAGMGGADVSMADASTTCEPAAGWFTHVHGGVAVYALLSAALLAVAFLGGAVCALTCRTMKGPGLGGARVPRAVFKASPKHYYAAVRAARKARRGASGAGWKLAAAALALACAAYLATKMIY